MILDELILRNYGVYKGEHSILLTPTARNPVVLIGALNGGGKTTILEALQVALFGRNANPVTSSKTAYSDYLRGSINSSAAPKQAGVELTFRYVAEGVERRYRVCRTWRESGTTVKETLEVYQDGQLDASVTERWSEVVEQLIPHQISDLFFFDGEKIESLADPMRSAELLRVGVHALLGLDVIDGLIKSLGQVERRRKAHLGASDLASKTAPVEEALTRMEARRAQLYERSAEARSELDGALKSISELQRRFEAEGGELYERQEVIRVELEASSSRKVLLEERMRDVACGVAPLLLVRNLFQEAKQTAIDEAELLQELAFAAALPRRDVQLFDELKRRGLKAEVLAVVEEVLSSDRSARAALGAKRPTLGVRPEALSGAGEESLAAAKCDIEALLSAFAQEEETLARIEARQAAIPEESKIVDLRDRLSNARREAQRLSARLELLNEEHQRSLAECERLKNQRDRLLDEAAAAQADDFLSRRIIEKSVKSRDSLQRFRTAMRGKHIARLEALVTECFQALLRKKSLVQRVSIHPESFSLTVVGNSGAVIPPERLSAGERQMLAVAMLWGLARASGRHLPAIIDTPLGRLDSEHRGLLVRNYFPAASHQVILLSTDEEINGAYYSAIKPHVSREYLIQYDHANHASRVFEGYFPQVRLAA